MPIYTIVSGDVTGAATKTILSLIAATTRRGRITGILIGSSATPADNAAKFLLRRFTADGTGTGVTPLAVDPAESTAILTAKTNYSAEPTYSTGSLLEIALNQRATFQWFPTEEKEKLVVPATSGNGIGLQMVSGPTVAYNVTFVYEE